MPPSLVVGLLVSILCIKYGALSVSSDKISGGF